MSSELQRAAVPAEIRAAWAARHGPGNADGQQELLGFVADHTPDGSVRQGVLTAKGFAGHCSVMMAAAVLGNGSKVSAPDTVPFALWCASHHLGEFVEGMWATVSALGDRDTTCAIVGSIIALSAADLPEEWLNAREPLKFSRPA